MAYLRLDGIDKTFGGEKVLHGISLDFAQGEFVTVLGPSGCGKTTLLSILSGICMPDTGAVLLEGADITGLPPEKRNFGMVFQNYALFPNLTVLDNITYGLFAKPRREAQERAESLINLTALHGLENRYPMELSGGQRQRVALARALATDPAVLLLDEPLSALDAQVRMVLGQELLRLQRETGVTTIMVTHDQQEALALADRVILLNNGRIVQAGKPQTLYAEPETPFAADFIGHMNTVRLPEINNGLPSGIRYEEVLVAEPSEKTLQRPNTWVGQVEHVAVMGPFNRITILLNDFRTRVHADVPRAEAASPARGALVAVTLPADRLRSWGAP